MEPLQSTVPPSGETDDQRDIRLNKDVAAFSYLWILSVLIYFFRKDSKFVRYHSKQGIVLFLMSIPVSMIPVVGQFFMFFLAGGMLLGFVNAAQGQYAGVPFVGELAKGDLKPGELWRSALVSLRKVIDMLEGFAHRTAKKHDQTHETMDSISKPPVP